MTQARAVTVLTGAGILIRYSFYLVALLVLAGIGFGLNAALGYRATLVEAPPAFRIAAPELAAMAGRTEVVTSGRIGRSEARHYGQIYDRERDLTVILRMPPKGATLPRDFVQEMHAIPILRNARAVLTSTYYDLETRFGPVRAAEMRVDADGRRKLCLAYLSRFDTSSVYLKGWACEANGTKPSPDALACTLNRLVLDGPLASAEADAFLRGRIGRGASCWAAAVTQTTDTRPYRPTPRRY